MTDLSRRSLLSGAAAWLFALSAVPAAAQGFATAPTGRFGSVAVDVDTLRAKGLADYADFIQASVLAEARRVFADRLGGPGPTLVIRITGVSLNMYVGSGGSGGRRGNRGGGSDSDYLEGEALIVGQNREILARYPQLSALPASSSGAWYTEFSEQKRTVNIAQHYVQWLRRTILGT